MLRVVRTMLPRLVWLMVIYISFGKATGHSHCPDSVTYEGHISVTDGGRMCQRWTDEEPHENNFVTNADIHYDYYYFYIDGSIEAAVNYCRNIGGDYAWCYTTDPDVEKEYCHTRICKDTIPTCEDGTDLIRYSGTVSVTDGLIKCQRWSEQTPHKHPFNTSDMFPFDGSVEDAANYCRNIGGDDRPWCLTSDPAVRWQYCYEQICNVSGSKCGGQLMGESGWFSPIDRDDDGTYDPHQNCLWTIIAPGNHVIELNFSTIDFPQGVSCEHNDFIQIYDGPDSSIYCHEKRLFIRSQSNVLHVRFASEHPNTVEGFKGFNATYELIAVDPYETTSPGPLETPTTSVSRMMASASKSTARTMKVATFLPPTSSTTAWSTGEKLEAMCILNVCSLFVLAIIRRTDTIWGF